MTAVTMFNASFSYGDIAPLPGKPTREKIMRLQQAIAELPQIDPEPVHYFADGMYGRELSIPAGATVVGKTHRHEHLVQLLSGEAVIVTEHGREHVVGPKTWVSPAGVKRALVTLTDCVFFTMHLNHSNTRDLQEIEDYVIEPDGLLAHDKPQVSDLSDDIQRIYA